MNNKPHVVVIMADQLRTDALGPHTPNLNALLGESVSFQRAYCASPLCVPARGAFFTGKYPNVTKSLNNAKLNREKELGNVGKEHTHMYRLMEEEWDSWHTGKMDFYTEERIERSPHSATHWLPLEPRYYDYLNQHGKRRPGGPDFKGIVPELAYGEVTHIGTCSNPTTGCYEEGIQYHYDGFILKDTMHALCNRDKNKPLLLNAMFFAPHPPIDIPEPWYSSIREEDVTLPDNVGVWSPNQSPLQLYNLPGVIGAQRTREQWREVWRAYLGFVSLLDDCVGQVISELKRQGIYDQTLLVFTSDHGEMLGSHRLWQKMCMYEESVKIPLWMKFPQGESFENQEIDHIVSSVDVLPTLCEYLEIEAPENMCGQSLMPVIRGEASRRESIFIQFDGNGSRSNYQRCVIEGRYKLIVDLFKDEIFLELYDVIGDSQEQMNLAFEPKHSAQVDKMLQSLRLHMSRTNDYLTLPSDVYEQFTRNYSEFKK
ncbi:sulfatase family protein [Paenibacillus chungangensis]|uniref:Sulfatase n=1 Tax=Paenibacillus chungangensis TaxID=696535 RepID=A0ABW3HUS7_9BACL